MSSGRSIILLTLACAAAAAANFALLSRDEYRKAGGGAATLLDPSAAASSIRIGRKGCPEILMEKSQAWRLVEPYAGSVDEPTVMKLLDALSFTPVDDAISETELLRLGRSGRDFALDEPVVRISVSGEGWTRTVSFGIPTPSADGVYAAVEGSESVLVVPSSVLAAVDLPPEKFRRRSLFQSGPESVASFDIKRAGGSLLSFARSGDSWTVDRAAAATQKVAKFLADLTSAEAVDFVWPVGASNEADRVSASLLAGYGLDPDSAVTVTLKGLDGAVRQISFGKAAGDGLAYALAQNGGAVVTVPAALCDAASQDAVMFTDSRLFPEEARSVAFFSLTDGEVVYALSRDEAGGWRLESPVAAAADAAVAEATLAKILALSPADADPDGISVAISTNSPAVRVARGSVLAGGFETLRSLEMLTIDPKDVKRIVRTPNDGKPSSVVFSRERQAWNVETAGSDGATMRPGGVETVLAAINPLKAVRVAKLKVQSHDLAAYGLDEPQMTVAIDQDREDAVRRNIMIGKEAADGRFATVGSADAVFVISYKTAESLSSPLVSE